MLPPEAVSLLAGRDRTGLTLAAARPERHALAPALTRGGTALAVVAGLAAGSYLVAQNVMAMAAFVPLILGTLWATEAILEHTATRLARPAVTPAAPAEIRGADVPQDAEEQIGLDVRHLDVRGPGGAPLLSDVSLQVGPGTITGIIGVQRRGQEPAAARHRRSLRAVGHGGLGRRPVQRHRPVAARRGRAIGARRPAAGGAR